MNTQKSFLGHDRPLLTVMVQAETPERIMELIDRARPKGADAFGMQLCQLQPQFRTTCQPSSGTTSPDSASSTPRISSGSCSSI